MRRRAGTTASALACVALAAGLGCAPPAAAQEIGLQPYQMVRSLQLVQDRIAGGDHAALPMQNKLLEMIDTRLRRSGDEEFADKRNFHALMVYAMSGGNPATIADILARLEIEESDRAAGAAILGYLLGDVAQSRAALSGIEPQDYPTEVAAFLSLVKGSVFAAEDVQTGLAMLDEARLLSPGTLVEEAALRRTVTLAAQAGQSDRFLSASEQYARRYLRSPYSTQFAEGFVSGIVELRQDIDIGRVEQAVAWMTQEQARTVYLRLARRAAIEGDGEMLAFASGRAASHGEAGGGPADPRSQLYAGISSVTSETVEEVLRRLQGLNPSSLSASDRALLTAAKAVAAEVVAPVRPAAVPPAASDDNAAENERLTAIRAKLDAVDALLEETRK